MSNEVTKSSADSEGNKLDLRTRLKIGPKVSGLAAKLAEQRVAEKSRQQDANEADNRIALVLDDSGSMSGSAGSAASSFTSRLTAKIDFARKAVEAFIEQCDFTTTALAMRGMNDTTKTALIVDEALLKLELTKYQTAGGTPLFQTLNKSLAELPLTRVVLVSDGEATDREVCGAFDSYQETAPIPFKNTSVIDDFKEASVPVDCVHIGDSHEGEATLRDIAKRTGGIYIKFSDVNSFAKQFSYLTPERRAKLFLPGGKALLDGADEVVLGETK